MNRRLFWKIFLPFWVAQALLLGVLYMRLHYRLHVREPLVGSARTAPRPALWQIWQSVVMRTAGSPRYAPCSIRRPCPIVRTTGCLMAMAVS